MDAKNRPVQTAMVFAPKVLSLDGNYLVCDANQVQSNPSGFHLLSGFLGLTSAEPDEILKFARTWGAFKIKSTPIPGLRFKEPIAVWHALAVQFRALHRIGADLNQERTGTEEEWRAIRLARPAGKRALDEARFLLMSNVRRLVNDAQLRPRLYWNKLSEQWQIDFDGPSGSNLLAVLALQLMVSIADKDGVALCSNCHQSYMPERRPSVGRRNYCQLCREAGVPFRDSKRERRRQEREGNALTKVRQ